MIGEGTLRWRRAGAAMLLVSVVLMGVPAAGQVPAAPSWPEPYGEGRRSASPASGPDDPGLAWRTVLADAIDPRRAPQEGLPGSFAGTIDAAGHILAVVQPPLERQEEEGSRLLAIRTADGVVDWELDGASTSCAPVVASDGLVWMVRALEPGGFDPPYERKPSELVAIDAASGQIVRRWDDGLDGPEHLIGCHSAPTITTEGDVVLLEHGFPGRIRSFDAATVEPRWTAEPAGPALDVRYDWVIAAGAGASAGDVYAGRQTQYEDGTSTADVVRLDGATGVVEATVALPDPQLGWPTSPAALEDEGLVVTAFDLLSGPEDRVELLRIADDGQTLHVAWSTELGERTSGYGMPEIWTAVGDDRVVVVGRLGAVESLDLATGDRQWVRELPANRGAYDVAMDGEGNIYYLEQTDPGHRAALVSDDRDGTRRWRAPSAALGLDGRLGAIGPDGRLYLSGQELEREESQGEALRAVVAAVDDTGALVPPPPTMDLEAGVRRLGAQAADAIDLAIAAAQLAFPDGGLAEIIVARDDVYADALAGAALAGPHTPILLTAGGPDRALDARTAAEIDRLLREDGIVHLLGGAQALSADVELHVSQSGHDVNRYEGPTRYETAAAIAREVLTRRAGLAVTDILIASGEDWPDAVTAGAYGAAHAIPLLLTTPDRLHPSVRSIIQDHGVTGSTVIGGTTAISERVLDVLPNPRRIAGGNRMATAVAVAEQLWGPAPSTGSRPAFIVADLEAADGWAHPLAAAPLSALAGAPQVGVSTDRYPEETRAYLEASQGGTPGILLLGPPARISTTVADAIAGSIGAQAG